MRFDETNSQATLTIFLGGYQTVTPLNIGGADKTATAVAAVGDPTIQAKTPELLKSYNNSSAVTI